MLILRDPKKINRTKSTNTGILSGVSSAQKKGIPIY